MREITFQTCSAFIRGMSMKKSNTSTDGKHLWLHGNLIAAHNGSGYFFTLAGWNTPTTRERLNGVMELLIGERPFHQVNFEPRYNGEPLDSYGTVVFNPDSRQVYISDASIHKWLNEAANQHLQATAIE